MPTTIIESTTNDSKKIADIISKSNTKLIVVLENTTIRLVLTRTDMKKPYVGKLYGVEIQSYG